MMSPFSNDAAHVAQLKSIEQQIKNNKLPEAARQLNALVKNKPDDPRIFLLGSLLAQAAHNPAGSLQAARKAHQLAPDWPVATIRLAEVLADQGEAEPAIALATRAAQQGATQTTQDTELLDRAATVAQRLNQYPIALQWLRQAQQIKPDETSIRYKIGISLANSGEPAQAVEIFTALLAQQAGNPTLLSQRMRAALRAGQAALAIQDGEALLALEPGNAVHQFYLDLAHGNTPKTQPDAIVTELFDGYAAQFDSHVAVQLQYQLPRLAAEKITGWYPDFKVDVLDLGCGTGLLGASLGPIDGALIGVDLSQQMIDKATAHHVYHRFHRVNVLDALADTPADHYDVITALDVLIYVGELDAAIPNALRILTLGGRFVFSCETGPDGGADYTLQSSLRYCHRRSYVERLLQQAGFDDIEVTDLVLRQEAGAPVPGFLVSARKPLKATKKTVRRSPKSAKPAPPAQ